MSTYNIIHNKVIYYDSPKCGSTTVFAYANLINNPELLEDFNKLVDQQVDPMVAYNSCVNTNKEKYSRVAISARTLIPPTDIPNQSIKFCIVRDPVERFISVYKALILDPWLVKTENPSIDEFIKIIDSDKNSIKNWTQLHPKGWNVIKYHFLPLIKFFGKDPKKFDHIFNIRQLNDVKSFLELHSNIKLPVLRLNNTPDVDIKLTERQIEWIKNRYSRDYRFYGKWM
jgi:hypothetical protein